MPINQNYVIGPGGGTAGGATAPIGEKLTSVINGTSQYYEGSTIRIREIWTLFITIDNPEIIDVDLSWPEPKYYLGTWQLGNPITNNWVPGTYGFINSQIQKVIQYNEYTVVANPSQTVAIGNSMRIDNCNFFLEPAVVAALPNPTPILGFKPLKDESLFVGTISRRTPNLTNQLYSARMSGISYKIAPGATLSGIEFTAEDINTISTIVNPYPVPTCGLPGIDPCNAEFAAFIAANPGTFFDNQSACDANSVTGPCTSSIYICSSDPTKTYIYWFSISV